MNYKTSDGITIIEGLEAVRRRPSMYIGAGEADRSPQSQLLEYVVSDIARELPRQRWQHAKNRALDPRRELRWAASSCASFSWIGQVPNFRDYCRRYTDTRCWCGCAARVTPLVQ
jgi:hypothetical protein